jgi:hypothetical protein
VKLALVVLAAGMSSRYGGLKQLEPVGPSGEALMDYGIYDAVRSGCSKLVIVIRPEIEAAIADHVEALVGNAITVAFVFQEIGNVPSRKAIPPGRERPWGTAHALLAASSEVSTPFMVCNADDFYGAAAYESLAGFLDASAFPAHLGTARVGEGVLVGYRLSDTLSPFGGVARAVCECDTDGYLERLVEVKQIEEANSQLTGVTEAGDGVHLEGSETVSMNLWGFTPAVFPLLKRQFEEFVASNPDDDAEFLIPSAVNEQLARGETRLRVLQARDKWFGMTFADDRPLVTRRIRNLVDRGIYPADLPAWFRQ